MQNCAILVPIYVQINMFSVSQIVLLLLRFQIKSYDSGL